MSKMSGRKKSTQFGILVLCLLLLFSFSVSFIPIPAHAEAITFHPLESLSGWTSINSAAGEVTGTITDSPITEGLHSLRMTFQTNPGVPGDVEYRWDTSPYDMSAYSTLAFDVYPEDFQTSSSYEPLVVKVFSGTGVIYEKNIPQMTSKKWNHITVNLDQNSIPRNQVTGISFYVSGADEKLESRKKLNYCIDNMRLINWSLTQLNGMDSLNGWNCVNSSAGTITAQLSGDRHIQGSGSVRLDYQMNPGISNWVNYVWGFNSYDMSPFSTIYLDIYPASQTNSASEPLVFKVTGSSGVVYESEIPRLEAGRWNTVAIDLAASGVPRNQITQLNLYVYGQSPKLEGRTNLTYYVDNLCLGNGEKITPDNGCKMLHNCDSLTGWFADYNSAGYVTGTLYSVDKIQGDASTEMAFHMNNGVQNWVNYAWRCDNFDLSEADYLTFDIYPESQTGGSNEPLVLKLQGNSRVLYEMALAKLEANTWNTVKIDLNTCNELKNDLYCLKFYMYGANSALEGRSLISYKIDNIQTVTKNTKLFSGMNSLWGSTNSSAGTASGLLDATVKTEGSYSNKVTFNMNTGVQNWVDYTWDFSNTDLSDANELLLDVYPTSQTSGRVEPLVIKISGEDGVLFEEHLTRLASNKWNSVRIDLEKYPVKRDAIKSIWFYMYGADSALESRSQISYHIDNLRLVNHLNSSSYPDSIPNLENGKSYPSMVLGMNTNSGWFPSGITNGNWLGTSLVDAPGRTGEKAVQFSFSVNKNSDQWLAWIKPLTPELSIEGVTKCVFDIYPLTAVNNPIYARFGTQVGQAILPCCASPIGTYAVPNQWYTVEIPIYNTRKSIDNLRFDLYNRDPAVPDQQNVSFIIDNLRFLPEPVPQAAKDLEELAVEEPVTAAYIQSTGSKYVKDNEKFDLDLQVEVGKPVKNASVWFKAYNMDNGKSAQWVWDTELKPPYTRYDISIPDMVERLGSGKVILHTEVKAQGDNAGWSGNNLTLELFNSSDMENQKVAALSRCNSLKALANSLESQGMVVAVPRISLTVAARFLENYIPDDYYRQNECSIAMDELGYIDNILDRAEDELYDRQNGLVVEEAVNDYNPALPVVQQGGNLTQNNVPLLLVGALVWGSGSDYLQTAKDLGFNSSVMETMLDSWFGANSTEGEQILQEYLSLSLSAGTAANVLLSAQNYSADDIAAYPGCVGDGAGGTAFVPYNILNSDTTALYNDFYDKVANQLYNKPVLCSVGTLNEPSYTATYSSTSFRDSFRIWASQKYTITTANALWGTNYADFASIDLVSFFAARKINAAAELDWQRFIDEKFSDFYQGLKNHMLAHLPDKDVWIKVLGEYGYAYNDAITYLKKGETIIGTDGNSEMWLDYMKSIAPDKALANTEWHMGYGTVHKNDASYINRSMFEGMVHGIAQGLIWQWSRFDWNASQNGIEDAMTRYPVTLDSMGRTALKLRSNAAVLTRFGNLSGGRMKIMLSRYSVLHQSGYMDSISTVYNKLSRNSDGVRFISNDTDNPMTLSVLTDTDFIAAGNSGYIPTADMQVLEQWVSNGGVLWLTSAGLQKDPWGVAHANVPAAFLNGCMTTGTTIYGQGKIIVDESSTEYVNYINGPWAGDSSGQATDPAEVEVRTATDANGDDWVYIMNRTDFEQEARLYDANGAWNPNGSGMDVWNEGETVQFGSTMVLEPNEVKLVKLQP